MVDLAAPLSSVHASLDELTDRVAQMAETSTAGGREEISAGLYEIERSLKAALRRMTALQREL